MLVKDRPRLTKQALDSIGAFNGMTVTILDDQSGDETQSILNQWTRSCGGRFVATSIENAGTGINRNAVIETSETLFGRGDYLYLSDNDVAFKPGWLNTLIFCYEKAWESGFRVLGAYNHPYHQPISSLRVMGNDMFTIYEVKEVLALALQSMIMKWEVWDKYGPFNRTTPGRVCDGEDVEFGNKIRADGGKLGVVSPALLVNCGITNSFGQKIPGWELVQKEAPAGVIVE